MQIKINIVLYLTLLFFIPTNSFSQDSKSITNDNPIDSILPPDFYSSTTIFQKILRDSFFEIILETNFDSLIKRKKKSTTKYKGVIKFGNDKGQSFKLNVKVTPRGRFRRKICTMPPLKIDFPKKGLAKLGLFPGCDKLKLVTHCNDNENSDQTLMKEYWVYKLYNKLTPNSFQVFPVKITYVNANDPTDRMERFAFFIENNEELARRLNGEIKEGFGITPDKLEKESYHNSLMFQYMIGNVDWDILVQRNLKLIKPKDDSLLIVVPYDFDYAGLVKAPYARLNPDLNQKNIEQRFCLGKFSNKEDLLERADSFASLKKEIYNCFKVCPILTKSQKRKMGKYLNSFFTILKDEEELTKIFLETP